MLRKEVGKAEDRIKIDAEHNQQRANTELSKQFDLNHFELQKEITAKNDTASYNLKSWAMKAMDEKIGNLDRRTKTDFYTFQREVKRMLHVPQIIGDGCPFDSYAAFVKRQADFNASCKEQLDQFKDALRE